MGIVSTLFLFLIMPISNLMWQSGRSYKASGISKKGNKNLKMVFLQSIDKVHT